MLIRVVGHHKLTGYRYWWIKGVKGFDPAHHCARCLIGPYFTDKGDFMANVDLEVKTGKGIRAIYVCGVAFAGYDANFHAPLVDEAGSRVDLPLVNGQRFIAEDAAVLAIPGLEAGYLGKSREFITCRNFQFGVAYFGPRGTVGAGRQPLLEL